MEKGEKDMAVNHERVSQMMERLSRVKWFSALGEKTGQTEAEKAWKEVAEHFDIDEIQIVWLTKDRLPALDEELSLGTSLLWSKLSEIPGKIKDQAAELGREAALSETIDIVAEKIFHGAFDGAFPELEGYGKRTVELAVGAALYICGLACVWEILGDVGGWEKNPYSPFLEVFEAGHWPVGMSGNRIFMI